MKNARFIPLFILGALLSFGCASAQVSNAGAPHVRLTEDGRVYVGDHETGLRELAGRLKKNGVNPQIRITVGIPANTSPEALSAIGRELASNGYRRFIFSKPRKAVVEKSVDPLLKDLR